MPQRERDANQRENHERGSPVGPSPTTVVKFLAPGAAASP